MGQDDVLVQDIISSQSLPGIDIVADLKGLCKVVSSMASQHTSAASSSEAPQAHQQSGMS